MSLTPLLLGIFCLNFFLLTPFFFSFKTKMFSPQINFFFFFFELLSILAVRSKGVKGPDPRESCIQLAMENTGAERKMPNLSKVC